MTRTLLVAQRQFYFFESHTHLTLALSEHLGVDWISNIDEQILFLLTDLDIYHQRGSWDK